MNENQGTPYANLTPDLILGAIVARMEHSGIRESKKSQYSAVLHTGYDIIWILRNE